MEPEFSFSSSDEIGALKEEIRDGPPYGRYVAAFWIYLYVRARKYAHANHRPDLATDTTENAYHRLVTRAAVLRYEGLGSFEGYCRKNIHWGFIDAINKDNDGGDELPDDERGVDKNKLDQQRRSLESRRFREQYALCRDRLSKREAQVVDLELDGLTPSQIADELNIRRNTVSVTRRNACKKLKPCFSGDDSESSSNF